MILSVKVYVRRTVRFHTSKYLVPSRRRYCACAGSFIATHGVIRTPPFRVEVGRRLRWETVQSAFSRSMEKCLNRHLQICCSINYPGQRSKRFQIAALAIEFCRRRTTNVPQRETDLISCHTADRVQPARWDTCLPWKNLPRRLRSRVTKPQPARPRNQLSRSCVCCCGSARLRMPQRPNRQ
jgi:hypothetical protein